MLDAKAESSTSAKQREYPSTFGVFGDDIVDVRILVFQLIMV
jgi:hypothetical protein